MALDQGGPIREFLTLFFDSSTCFSNGTVTSLSAKLKSEEYLCLGRLMALAAVHGHPGPRCFMPSIARAMVTGHVPVISEDELLDGRLKVAIAEVTLKVIS